MSQPFLIPSLDDQNFGFVGLPASGSAALLCCHSLSVVAPTLSDEPSVRTELSEMVL